MIVVRNKTNAIATQHSGVMKGNFLPFDLNLQELSDQLLVACIVGLHVWEADVSMRLILLYRPSLPPGVSV